MILRSVIRAAVQLACSGPISLACSATPESATAGARTAVIAPDVHVSAEVSSAEANGVEPYARRTWRHWVDDDHDCQDTREEVLIAESEVPVEFADGRNCKVKRGRWTCPYTGTVVTDPAQLDVDHVVPLENAHLSGAWRWSAERKRAFANDLDHPEHLIAVLARANRQKGSKSPERWMPTSAAFRCKYIEVWVGIKARWQLSETTGEAAAIKRAQTGCPQPGGGLESRGFRP